MSGIPIPNCSRVSEFLKWWVHDGVELLHGDKVYFDVSNLNDSIRSTVIGLVEAFGATCKASDAQVAPRSRGAVIMSETIFADTEKREDVLARIFSSYLRTLDSVSRLNVVPNVDAVHVTYCSIDKLVSIVSLANVLRRLQSDSKFVRFVLVPYAHPEDGYAAPSNGHIDAVRLPNKYSEDQYLKIFRRAELALSQSFDLSWPLVFRLAMDDDDLWLPWAFEEILRVGLAAKMSGGRATKAIGVCRHYVYYPIGTGRVEVCEWNVALTGSKFWLSDSWEGLSHRSPFGLPEYFSANVQRNFRSMGVDLWLTRSVRAFWLYVRSFGNLSSVLKTQHYTSEPLIVEGVGTADNAYQYALLLQQENASDAEIVFSIDPPTLSASGVYDPDGRTLTISSNTEEVARANSVDLSTLNFVVNYGTAEGRGEIRLACSEPLILHVDGWTQRTLVRVEDNEGKMLGSAWLRGSAPFLS